MANIIDLDAEEAPKPRILVISLEYLESFDDIVSQFLTPMLELAIVQRVKKAATLTRLLSKEDAEPYSALVLTDAALTLPENLPLWEQVLAYLRRTGATAVLTGQVANFAIPDDLDEFFRVSGLPDWKGGMYQRNIVVMNEKADGIRDATHFDYRNKNGLKTMYSVKSLCLSGVRTEHRWYVPDANLDDGGGILNLPGMLARGPEGRDPERVHLQTAVAYGPVGEKGRIGWVGDVNSEEPSCKVILAMCGLDPAKASIEPYQSSTSGSAAMRWDAGQGRFVKV
ncbi:hypothetical protein B0H65DRAFT_124595 [Neurospora tetraspora]|uniref:Uncharacterized protein n=1 Tax=Neurospora tetraspora TaxID=94610 RepID=A0AAE0JM43_9PEZI|nr:hypothetical protein B0H65DRAFT_124595 [Neurospora tetraspora]